MSVCLTRHSGGPVTAGELISVSGIGLCSIHAMPHLRVGGTDAGREGQGLHNCVCAANATQSQNWMKCYYYTRKGVGFARAADTNQ